MDYFKQSHDNNLIMEGKNCTTVFAFCGDITNMMNVPHYKCSPTSIRTDWQWSYGLNCKNNCGIHLSHSNCNWKFSNFKLQFQIKCSNKHVEYNLWTMMRNLFISTFHDLLIWFLQESVNKGEGVLISADYVHVASNYVGICWNICSLFKL